MYGSSLSFAIVRAVRPMLRESLNVSTCGPPHCLRAASALVGVAASAAAAARSRRGTRAGHHARLRGLVSERRRHVHAAHRLLQSQRSSRRSTSRSARTTGSSPAVPIRGSRRTSCRAGSGACSPSRCRRTSATSASPGRSSPTARPTSIPVGVIKGYQVEPFQEAAQKNEPPRLQFDPKGPAFFGPPVGIAATLTGTVGQPVTITGDGHRRRRERSRPQSRFS